MRTKLRRDTLRIGLGKLAAWALTSDTKAADLAKQVQSIMKLLQWGFFILAVLILLRR